MMKNKEVLRNLVLLTSLVGIGLFFNSCASGYVATEPTYMEYSRPQQPSNYHIWIDGDWTYDRKAQTYIKKSGYWAKPNPQRTFVAGHWESTPRGQYWVDGRWHKVNQRGNKYYR